MSESRRNFLKHGLTFSAASISGIAAGEDLDEEVRREMARRINFLVPPGGVAPDLVMRPSPCVTPFTTDLFVPRVAEPLIDLTLDIYLDSWKHEVAPGPLVKHLKDEKILIGNETVFLQTWADPGEEHTSFSSSNRMDMEHFVDSGLLSSELAERMGSANQRYLILFYLLFQHRSKQLRSAGIDLGSFPIIDAHQRFMDFKPLKFYAVWEVEFPWIYSAEDCRGSHLKDCPPPLSADPDEVDWRDRKNKPWPHARPVNWSRGAWTWGVGQLVRTKGNAVNPLPYPDRPPIELRRPGVDPQKLESLGYKFEASSPGPTFYARYNEPIMVRRINALPEMLNDDDIHKSLDAGSINPAYTGARSNVKFAMPSTTSHLHNGHTASESDGHPNDWINSGEYWDHHYGNFASGHDDEERLTTLWYHDHRMDSTAANVYAGLDGFYFLFDEKDSGWDIGDENDESSWQLPSGKYDVPLIFHDLAFGNEKSHAVAVPNRKPNDPAFPQLVFDGFNTDGILGDRFTTNRIIQPVMQVEPRKYRFRLLNGGPSRFYEFVLYDGSKDPINWSAKNSKVRAAEADAKYAVEEEIDEGETETDVIPFIVITGDGNFQTNPVIARSLYFSVAQRVDVVIDFSEHPDCTLYLVNQLNQTNGRGPDGRVHQRADYGKKIGKPGDRPSDDKVSSDSEEWFFKQLGVVKFEVGPKNASQKDPSKLRLKYRDTPKVDLTEVRRERHWDFDYDGGMWTVNGLTYDPNRIDAGIEQDSAEIWTFRNVGATWSHPIHSHFTEFLMLEINGVPVMQNRVSEGNQPDRAGAGVQLLSDDKDLTEQLHRVALKRIEHLERVSRSNVELESIQNDIRDTVLQQHRFMTTLAGTDQFGEIKTLANELASNEKLTDADLTNAKTTFERCNAACAGDNLLDREFSSAAELRELLIAMGLDLRDYNSLVHPEIPNGRFSGGPRRDVALLLPDWEVKVFMRWKDFLGKHVMHCHNVVHEDHAMMIRWDIVPQGHGFDTPKTAHQIYGKEEGIPHIEMSPRKGHAAEDDSDMPRGR